MVSMETSSVATVGPESYEINDIVSETKNNGEHSDTARKIQHGHKISPNPPTLELQKY